MVDVPLMWQSSARKESMDLLQQLWAELDGEGRRKLSESIISGPPSELLERIDEEERQSSRDRRIFDRIVILERAGDPPLTQALRDELSRISQLYPEWRVLPGEQAHFASWLETRIGPETKYGAEDLAALEDPELTRVLLKDQEMRSGLLESWRQLAANDSDRALRILETISDLPDRGPVDVWRHGLWGLRDQAKGSSLPRLMALLVKVPDALFEHDEFSSAVADILQTVSGVVRTAELEGSFWALFDRTLAFVRRSDAAPAGHTEDWVSLAINDPLGYLAQAFFNALFGRGLKVGDGIPEDLRPRIDQLVDGTRPSARIARVIASSRLSYLFAVDPSWTSLKLLPSFDWSNEEESQAVWQGYAWQARIDAALWGALKSNFLDVFTESRLARFGASRRTLAELLMLVGIEFGLDTLPRERVRAAIRLMPEEMRADAIRWVESYLARHSPQTSDDKPEENDVDELWRDRVAPWIKRVWPADPELRSANISDQLALVAIATDREFGSAVALIRPMLVRSGAFYVLHQLGESDHPDVSPRPCLNLIEALLDPDQLYGRTDEVRAILSRIIQSDPELAADASYRRWDARLRAQE